jgi:hypothetical protein
MGGAEVTRQVERELVVTRAGARPGYSRGWLAAATLGFVDDLAYRGDAWQEQVEYRAAERWYWAGIAAERRAALE